MSATKRVVSSESAAESSQEPSPPLTLETTRALPARPSVRPMLPAAHPPPEPDIELEVRSNKASVRAAGPAPEEVGGELPWSLVLGLWLASREGRHREAVVGEIQAWLRTHPALWRRFASVLEGLPEAGHGALLRLSVQPVSRWMPEPIVTWWALERGRWTFVTGEALEPWRLWKWRIRLRLAAGGWAAVWRSVVVAGLLTALTGIGLLPWLDELAYVGAQGLLERPEPSGGITVVFLPPPVKGSESPSVARSSQALIARTVEGLLARGARQVGLDLWLDRDDLPGSDELAATLHAHRDRVVVGEYRSSEPGQRLTVKLAPKFAKALREDAAGEGVAGEGGAVPVAYAGLRNYVRDRFLFRTRLFYQPPVDEGGQNPDRVPLLGAELYRRSCLERRGSAGVSRCAEALEAPVGMVWLRYPTFTAGRDFLRLPDLGEASGEAVRAALAPLPMEGRAVLVSSWDDEDLRRVPVDDRSRGMDEAMTWPGVLLQAAVFETLEAGQWNRALTGVWPGWLGLLAYGLFLGAVSLVLGAWRVVWARGGWAWLVLMGLGWGLAVGVLAHWEVWMPWASSGVAMAGVWFWLARRHQRRRGRGQAGLSAFEEGAG